MGGHELVPGGLIAGKYRLVARLGVGATGEVWRARSETVGREFALKIMTDASCADPRSVQRFLNEARIVGGLRHPSIVEVYDAAQLESSAGGGSTPYIVMELLEGETLAAMLDRVGQLPTAAITPILIAIARALHLAHDRGIVHRDLKPANIFLARANGTTTPKLLDFGISKLVDAADSVVLTTVGTLLGSPAYMSPEQSVGSLRIDARSDVWAFGVILYRALAGTLPFNGPNLRAVIHAINDSDARRLGDLAPAAPRAVCDVAHRALQKVPEARFASAGAFADALEAATMSPAIGAAQAPSSAAASASAPTSVPTMEASPRTLADNALSTVEASPRTAARSESSAMEVTPRTAARMLASDRAPVADPRMSLGNMYGTGLVGGIEWFVRKYGPVAAHETIARLPREWRSLVTPNAPALGILGGRKYPYPFIGALARTMASVVRRDEDAFLADFAEAGFAHSVNTVSRVIVRYLVSPAMIQNRGQELWDMMHDSGKLTVLSSSDREYVVEISAWPNHDLTMCKLTTEVRKNVLFRAGLRGLEVRRERCQSWGHPTCVTRARWAPK